MSNRKQQLMKILFLALSLVMTVAVLGGCAKTTNKQSDKKVESKASSSSESSEETNGKTDLNQLLASAEKVTPKLSGDTKIEKLFTSDNGVVKQAGLDGGQIEVGYKNYQVPDDWTLNETMTRSKDRDVVWDVTSKIGDYELELYMLPTYTGDIGNMEGKRLTEADLPAIMKKDDYDFIKTGTTMIGKTKWHVGVEAMEEHNAARITFFRMEPDKGSFNESVIIGTMLFGYKNYGVDSKSVIARLAEQKAVLESFGKTKTETVAADSAS